MGAGARDVGARMADVLAAFVDDFELIGVQHVAQTLRHLVGEGCRHG